MPFLPSLAGIKDVANSINPLNLLNSIDNAFTPQPTHPSQPHSAASASASAPTPTRPSPSPPPSAEAGPGPSTQAQSISLGHVPPGEYDESNGHADGREGRPERPSLRDAHLSSSDSSDGLPRPRASGVVIARPVSVGVESRRRKNPTDQYIIVKPPPTASKNPLNLQIQLVVRPPRRDRSESNVTTLRSPSLSTAERFSNLSNPSSPSTPTFDLDIPRSETPTAEPENPMIPLSRQTSRKSSTSTTLSAISTASGKRIEPMFNLQVHNVVHPTTVTDAATDVKVAKFLKRNVDISGVGVIEPAEVWHNTAPFDDPPQRSSRPVSMYSLTVPISPTATRDEPRSNRNSLDLTLRPDVHQGGATRKFLGKMFKKKTSQDFANPRKSPSPSFSSLSAHEKLPSVPAPPTRPPSGVVVAPPADHALGAPTFGTSPLVVTRRSSGVTSDTALGITSSVSYASLAKDAPSTRPVGYSWTVKRWAKRNTEGWAAHLVAAAAAGLDMVNGALTGEGEDGVVFEWVKQRPAVPSGLGGPPSRRLSIATTSRSRSRPPSATDRHSPPITTTASLHPPKRDSVPSSPTLDARPEPVRRVSASASPISRHSPEPDASSVNHTDEESDPEDSETPWTCSIWVKKTGHRQVLGTLTPAPHHPKVIAQLKIPTRLDAVALAEVKGSRSELAKRVKAEVALTEENLKDVVCVTAMWLVAREEFGGLGRKRRA